MFYVLIQHGVAVAASYRRTFFQPDAPVVSFTSRAHFEATGVPEGQTFRVFRAPHLIEP